jgi:hypothetical protein
MIFSVWETSLPSLRGDHEKLKLWTPKKMPKAEALDSKKMPKAEALDSKYIKSV